MAKEFKDMVFALDIGTAKVMVVAAEVMPCLLYTSRCV